MESAICALSGKHQGTGSDRPPDPLRGRWADEIRDTERCKRVEDGVGDGRECADGAGLAAAFNAERVGGAPRAVEAEIV